MQIEMIVVPLHAIDDGTTGTIGTHSVQNFTENLSHDAQMLLPYGHLIRP